MSGLAVQIQLTGDALAGLGAVARGLDPARLQPVVGRSARNTYRDHLFGLNGQRANALGGPRTNFYARAGRATQFRIEGDHVVVSINQVGMRLRYFGGTVKPKTRKFLTIPAIPEAHGKRASEFADLHFAFVADAEGRLRPALVQGARTLIRTRRVKGAARVYAAGQQARRAVFWLVKSATFQPDETVLPYPELVQAQALRAVTDYTRLLAARQQPPPAAN
jgi:hypothetical protein